MAGSLAAARQNLPKEKRFRPLTSREEIFDEMLDHFKAAQETLWSGQGADAEADGGVRAMPAVWNDSYRELERVLQRMKNLATPDDLASMGFRLAFFALRDWYLHCVKHPVYDPAQIIRFQKRGILHEEEKTKKVVRWRIERKADPRMVHRGIEWISGEFVGEPFLPKEIVEVAA